MSARRLTGLATSWPWRRKPQHPSTLPSERAAERTESYVYGNVLVLAALAAVELSDVATGRAALLILGTGVSTFVAHLLALSVGHSARRADGAKPAPRHSIRDSVPIATSGLIPTVLLAAGWWGWLDAAWSLGLAIAVIVVRFVWLGSVVSYINGEDSTWKNVLIGLGLAAAGLVVAAVKFLLTH